MALLVDGVVICFRVSLIGSLRYTGVAVGVKSVQRLPWKKFYCLRVATKLPTIFVTCAISIKKTKKNRGTDLTATLAPVILLMNGKKRLMFSNIYKSLFFVRPPTFRRVAKIVSLASML